MSMNRQKSNETEDATRVISGFRAGIERCEEILLAAPEGPHGSDIARLYRRISTLRRKRFLAAVEDFLSSLLHAEVAVICSEGRPNARGGRRISLISPAKAVCSGPERLYINITGLDSGALIPLISIADGGAALEGFISVASDKKEIGEGSELDFLCAAAPLIAQCFRNLKSYAALLDLNENERRRSAGASGGHPGVPDGFIGKLKNVIEEKERAMETRQKARDAGPRSRGRRRHSLWRRIFTAMFVLVFLFAASALASYTRVPVLNEPFNNVVALLGEAGGIPMHATKRALDDGLLRVWIVSGSAQDVHDWLKGENPSGVDYEELLKKHGWTDGQVHRVGRVLGMVP
ncbi:MAG: hypothetical protein ABIH04_03225 [Planctomycetota bacterium]